MSENADRYNDGKRKWSLVDFKSLEPMVEVLEFGALKYAPNDWKRGLPVTEICESMLRHIHAILAGEDLDPESGLPHSGHILCNGMFLSHMMDKPDMDDRTSPEIDKSVQLNMFEMPMPPDLDCPHGVGSDCIACDRQGK